MGYGLFPSLQSQQALDSLFTQWADSKAAKPGVVVHVLKSRESVYSKAFGYANLEYEIPLDEHSVFDLGSVSKTFTGFAVAKLVLDKKLDMDDPVQPFFPELEALSPDLKIKHLVYQTSGLVDVESLYTQGNYACRWTANEALELLKAHPEVHFPLGTRFDYSNTNYVLLALIVEKISKTSFRKWCQSNIFEPLGMSETFIGDNPREIIKNRATAYYTEGSYFSFFQKNGMSLIGCSAAYSTLHDMKKWLLAVQSEEQFPEVFQLMKQKGSLDSGEPVVYGFGLFIRKNTRDMDLIFHLGGTRAGFRTLFITFPNYDFSFLALSNWGNYDLNELSIGLIDHCLEN